MLRKPGRRRTWSGHPGSQATERALLEALPDASAILDEQGVIRSANQAWQEFAAATPVTAGAPALRSGLGGNYLAACAATSGAHAFTAQHVATAVRAVLSGQVQEQHVEYACQRASTAHWFLLRATALAGPRPGALICRIDISARKAGQLAAARRAAADPLTRVANSAHLRSRLTEELHRQGDCPGPPSLGVVFIDLDHFKPVNDRYGHAAGDQVLIEVARRLAGTVRPHDTVGRVGGDEFAIIVPCTTTAALDLLVRRLSVDLSQPHLVQGASLQVGASVGGYLARPGESAAVVLAAADRRMYEVKHRPGACA